MTEGRWAGLRTINGCDLKAIAIKRTYYDWYDFEVSRTLTLPDYSSLSLSIFFPLKLPRGAVIPSESKSTLTGPSFLGPCPSPVAVGKLLSFSLQVKCLCLYFYPVSLRISWYHTALFWAHWILSFPSTRSAFLLPRAPSKGAFWLRTKLLPNPDHCH